MSIGTITTVGGKRYSVETPQPSDVITQHGYVVSTVPGQWFTPDAMTAVGMTVEQAGRLGVNVMRLVYEWEAK